MARIGFIGLDHLGPAMAAKLSSAGHRVTVFDICAAAIKRAVAAGCVAADSAGAATKDAVAVITMLPSGRHVRDVMFNEVFAYASPNTLLIDCSTIDVATTRALNLGAAWSGHLMVDAPVSGRAGSLAFAVGGSATAFARAHVILSAMSNTVIHAGAPGAGQAAKICNSMLLSASVIATCEAVMLAEKLGLDPQTFLDIASKVSLQSRPINTHPLVHRIWPTSPADHHSEGGFSAELQLRDLKLAIEEAESVDTEMPISGHAAALYGAFVNLGGGGCDFSAIIKLLDGTWPSPSKLCC